jgi:hypothetical protein
MINMISNSFCTHALLDGRVNIATVQEVSHACAMDALICVNLTGLLQACGLAEP